MLFALPLPASRWRQEQRKGPLGYAQWTVSIGCPVIHSTWARPRKTQQGPTGRLLELEEPQGSFSTSGGGWGSETNRGVKAS